MRPFPARIAIMDDESPDEGLKLLDAETVDRRLAEIAGDVLPQLRIGGKKADRTAGSVGVGTSL